MDAGSAAEWTAIVVALGTSTVSGLVGVIAKKKAVLAERAAAQATRKAVEALEASARAQSEMVELQRRHTQMLEAQERERLSRTIRLVGATDRVTLHGAKPHLVGFTLRISNPTPIRVVVECVELRLRTNQVFQFRGGIAPDWPQRRQISAHADTLLEVELPEFHPRDEWAEVTMVLVNGDRVSLSLE